MTSGAWTKRAGRGIARAAVLLILTGCAASHPKPTAPAPLLAPSAADAANTAIYHDHGITFRYPVAWKLGKGTTAVFRVIAPGPAVADLNLDVPAVPSFAAAFVNPTIVGSNYGADERKQEIPDATVTYADVPAAGGTGRRIKLVGHDANGHVAINEAIALVHAGHVYIFSTNTDDAGYATAKAALDAAVASVRWD